MFARLMLTVILAIMPVGAQAQWREARSKNFIVYSAASEASVRQAISDLEKYDFMLRFMTGVGLERRGQQVRVYMLGSIDEVAASLGPRASGIAGYYSTGPNGAMAVSTRQASGGREGLPARQVLFHELAHHFMRQYFPAAYPVWYSEGFADFYGSARIGPKDVIEVGHAVQNRYLSLMDNQWMPLRDLLVVRDYRDARGRLDLVYAQGWLLTHYLSHTKERGDQLRAYLKAINAGKSYAEARDLAFGKDARELNGALRSYAASTRLQALALPFKPIDVGEIAIRRLSPAEDSLIDYALALDRGLVRSKAKDFVKRLEAAATRFPDDPAALRLRVEANLAAGNPDAARTALDRWIKQAPRDPLALMFRGQLAADTLGVAGSKDAAAWKAARADILAANALAPRTPRILRAYYESFVREGVLPPPGAQNGLVTAFEMVPQDPLLRYMVAADFEQRGMVDAAIETIAPIAFETHDTAPNAEEAKREAEERERNRLAGDHRTETPAEMLARLRAVKAKSR